MVTYASAAKHLQNRFQKEDPWKYGSSEYEKQRFLAMVKMIRLVPHASILEVGCAEGHFTELLTQISNDVTGIDIIPKALDRAKKRAPKATYILSSIEEFTSTKKYDVVICADIIYYCPNKKLALQRLAALGKYLVVGDNILCNWRPNTGDRHFWKFPLIKWQLLWKENKLSLISLRTLQTN